MHTKSGFLLVMGPGGIGGHEHVNSGKDSGAAGSSSKCLGFFRSLPRELVLIDAPLTDKVGALPALAGVTDSADTL